MAQEFYAAQIWIRRCGCLIAAVLSIAAPPVPHSAAAADSRDVAVRIQEAQLSPAIAPQTRSVTVERRALPEVAPGGTVVLRGSRTVSPNAGPPNLGGSGEGYGSSNAPAGAPPAGAGIDPSLDASGFDRTGLNPRSDTIGLEPIRP
jgi:hypothetical protein